MKRKIDQVLQNWKQDKRRKVLLVRGARQVGKTYSIRELAKTFDYYIEANFELDPEIAMFFERSLSPRQLCEKLSLYYNQTVVPGKTLLFFDEIQNCPQAIRSLRYFHEIMPDLHVAAAGSLLEFALEEISSFGVGRIKSVFIYPLTFDEFLTAKGEGDMAEMIRSASARNPVDPVLNLRLLDQFRIIQVLGGMPEVIDRYLREGNIQACQETIDAILISYRDDFAKYKKKSPVSCLLDVYQSCLYQAGKKFKFSEIGPSRIESYKNALFLLEKAGLIYRVLHTSAGGLPLGAQANPKRFKVIPNDTGLYQRSLGLNLSEHITADFSTMINKGALAEIFVGAELVSHQFTTAGAGLFYWHREARASNAEVDYVISLGGRILPVEVKSGSRGRMKSMQLFLQEKKLPMGIRISAENFSFFNNILTVPIYAIRSLFEKTPEEMI